ncbi:hypothetical protein ACGFIR_25605 [Micromonospora sp. NPDC049051]|uniref:hypothetical protein n=1 Tax=Micromonospora sp. NPDC049051 TaxID=3364264 RepID=UPI0037107D73
MSGAQLYDTIGAAYTVTRRTEPRIAAQVWAALGDARWLRRFWLTRAYQPEVASLVVGRPSLTELTELADAVDLDTAELGLRLLVA